MVEQPADVELDARGLSCPMPLVKARQAIGTLRAGQILKVTATDRGSVKDFQGWANVAKNIELIGQETVVDGGSSAYVHYIRKTV
jgi:tRNA 2-thiouridine synthesizing protein A